MPGGAFVHPLPPYRIDGVRPPVTRPAPPLGGGASPLPPRPATTAPPPAPDLDRSSCPAAAAGGAAGARRHLDVGRPGGRPALRRARGRRDPPGVGSAAGPVPAEGRQRGSGPGLVGARAHLVHGQLQQARPDPRPQPPGRPRAARAAAAELRRPRRELRAPGLREVRFHPGPGSRAQPGADLRADARVRPGRPVARPDRLRPDDGADERPGLADRTGRRRGAGRAARALRPAGGLPDDVRAAGGAGSAGRGLGGCLLEAAMAESAVNAAAESVVDYSAYGVLPAWSRQPQPGRRAAGPVRVRRRAVDRDLGRAGPALGRAETGARRPGLGAGGRAVDGGRTARGGRRDRPAARPLGRPAAGSARRWPS